MFDELLEAKGSICNHRGIRTEHLKDVENTQDFLRRARKYRCRHRNCQCRIIVQGYKHWFPMSKAVEHDSGVYQCELQGLNPLILRSIVIGFNDISAGFSDIDTQHLRHVTIGKGASTCAINALASTAIFNRELCSVSVFSEFGYLPNFHPSNASLENAVMKVAKCASKLYVTKSNKSAVDLAEISRRIQPAKMKIGRWHPKTPASIRPAKYNTRSSSFNIPFKVHVAHIPYGCSDTEIGIVSQASHTLRCSDLTFQSFKRAPKPRVQFNSGTYNDGNCFVMNGCIPGFKCNRVTVLVSDENDVTSLTQIMAEALTVVCSKLENVKQAIREVKRVCQAKKVIFQIKPQMERAVSGIEIDAKQLKVINFYGPNGEELQRLFL